MSLCTLCGATFHCGQTDPASAGACWCMALPPAVPVPGSTTIGCWCPACLQAHIAAQTAPIIPPTSVK
ncbi:MULTISPECIES: cysteine-rich CWC family protein [unclassified Janthinobacterium]|uniref:cysteine-rich CWC family protein n=1 Tax=unclassified Janthinobacterium TaxID=2610881 RepID=UPI0016229185|nr:MULTISPECIES: cysteine-rich CWC family protein [unclassified Janthinobacterium]